jgi:tRNA(Ile)-lysidine synthase
MSKAFEKVREFIKSHSMLDGATDIVVAVSGGPDSVVLLDILVRVAVGGRGLEVGKEHGSRGAEERRGERTPLPLRPSAPGRFSNPQPLSPNPRLHVAHLDHKLRGRESAEDAEFVRALSESLGLQVTIASVDVRTAAQATGRGIEETARELRYDFLLRVASENACERIAVGHTMTDQAETFLMRLVRGAGLRGLSAMRPVVSAHDFEGRRAEERRGRGPEESGSLPSPLLLRPSAPQFLRPLLIRPLLCITREEVATYCRERGLEFRTDETNQSSGYTRNRIRNEVIPALSNINPQVVKSVARAAKHLASDQDLLDSLASSLLDRARVNSSKEIGDGYLVAYSVTTVLEQPAGLRRRMIIEALRQARAGANPTGGTAGETISAHVEAIQALTDPAASGKHVALSGGLEAWREFDKLVLKQRPVPEESTYEHPLDAAGPDVEAGGFIFTLQRGLPSQLLKSVIEETRREKVQTGRDWMTVGLDDQALPERLLIRPRRRGERALVVGQSQTKKLKNLMIDHRIPCSRRATWPIVTTPDGCYIWSPGLPPSLEFAARDETDCLATIRVAVI